MSCCPVPVIKSCQRCIPPAPIRYLPSYPTPYTSPCQPIPVCSPGSYLVYGAGGYCQRPWEGLCGHHPFQGDFKQLIYYQSSSVRWFEWLWLFWLWFISYIILPLLLVYSNMLLITYVSRLLTVICALVFNAYYDILSDFFRNHYALYRENLQRRSSAKYTFMQIIQSYRPCYNQITFQYPFRL
uniref:Uncharacterized protein n=1 Tax=Homalodisca liturata TaxID=320908 RepID=A0A1B6K1T2_9HEMI